MRKEELDAVISDAVNDSELRSAEIPAIDLYVDQIINLVAEKQKEGSERFYDRQLTKTMINNYSKDGVIKPVKGKKYTKEQILQILTVYSMKSTLSIGEIKRMLTGAYSIEGFDGEALNEFYDRYMDIKDDNRVYAKRVIDGMIEAKGIDVENEEDFLAALGGIVSLSAFFKNIAQAMIDAKYPEPEEPEEDEDGENAEKSEKKKEKEKKKAQKKEEKKNKKAEESVTEAEVAEG
ncbi:MAG: DUF1836 domain-containing protein [Clostridia bacterium]|nr:DUF1836 domain-containing protein [Clostridia bacterium]